ncbi:hypothetical protein D3C84_986190 [compost metagenome]
MSTGGPVFEPVGTIDLVLVEQVGQALGKLVALAQVTVVSQEALQGLEMRLVDHLRQQTHQTPGQWCLIEQGNFRNFFATQHPTVELPHETAG